MKIAIAAACTLAALAADARAECSPDNLTSADVTDIYARAVHHSLESDGCVRHSTTFKELVWVGSFANDRGCMGEGVIASCVWNATGYAAKAMARAGWVKAPLAAKRALALAWLRELENMNLYDGGDAPKKVTAPKAELRGEGLVVTAWVQAPPGMLPQREFYELKIEFAADGSIAKRDNIDSVTVPIR